MQFEGAELEAILLRQAAPVSVFGLNGTVVNIVPGGVAAKIAVVDGNAAFVGIGHRKRIRYIRPKAIKIERWSGADGTRPVRADQTCSIYANGQLMGNARTLREFTANR